MIYNELTENLINEIKDSTSLYKYINKYDSEFPKMNLSHFIELNIQKKNLKKSEVIKHSELPRTFAYQMFSGKRKASRDATILLSYGLRLSLEETQQFLKLSEHNPLTPKVKRDAVIIFSKINDVPLRDTNTLLLENNENCLF